MRPREVGVSLLELTIAVALTLAITAGLFAMVRAGWRASASEPDTADMQQRLRVAADTITRDLTVAGAGSYLGGQAAALVDALPPVLPFQQGAVRDDPAGTFRTDTITLISVPATPAQTTLRAGLAPGERTLQLAPQSTCPAGVNLCGFAAGMMLLVYDDTGNYDTFTVAAVDDQSAEIGISARPQDSSETTYKAGSRVVEAQLHAYYLKTDAATHVSQLVHYDGSSNAAVPVVDHVVGLRFDYYGEPRPPALSPSGATYGPAPPPIGVRTTAYPPGENCLFAADTDTGVRFPRLPVLGADDSLSPLTAAQLTDGPWCPDDVNGNRWDADLLRIRAVAVTVRVESASAGTSLEVRFQVTPRNLSMSAR